jgi:hypothetical protein
MSAATIVLGIARWGSGAIAAAVACGLAKVVNWPIATMVGLAASEFSHGQTLAALARLLPVLQRPEQQRPEQQRPEQLQEPPMQEKEPDEKHSKHLPAGARGPSKQDEKSVSFVDAAGHSLGFNTSCGSRHRCANQDLRPLPPCPFFPTTVSIWHNPSAFS